METSGYIQNKKRIRFYVDKEDRERVEKLVWRVDHRYLRNKSVYLHRFILNFPKGKVDHIDGNPLNNRRSNLRVCTQQENTMNKRGSKSSSSKFKGVSWLKRDKRWYACINKNYKTYAIGYFKNEVDAAKAYDKKAIELFGQFAKTNYGTL